MNNQHATLVFKKKSPSVDTCIMARQHRMSNNFSSDFRFDAFVDHMCDSPL